jgi:organic radical activating enzyme
MKVWSVGTNMKIVSCTSQDKILRINWHILNWCNLKCSYCNVKEHLSYDYNDNTQISNNYKLIISRLKTISKPFEICLTGGEPTLHPNIEDILSGLNEIENLTKIYFFTNLTRSENFYKNIKSFSKVTYYASFHPEYHKEDFLDKCKNLNCEVHISMMPEYKNYILKIIDKCKLEDIKFTLNFLRDTKYYSSNLEEDFFVEASTAESMIDMDVLYDNGFRENTTNLRLLYDKKNNFKGYKCLPESFQIELNNVVKNVCTNEIMPLSLKDITKKVICPKEVCEGGLMMYPKEI